MNLIRDEQGLTLIEVIVALSITSMLMLGVGQILSLGVKALQFSGSQSASTVKQSNATRVFTQDVSAAVAYFIAGATVGTSQQMARTCTTWSSAATTFTNIRPLLTLDQGDGSEVGYEIRRTATGAGELWRVTCASLGSSADAGNQVLVSSGVVSPLATLNGVDRWTAALTCSGTVTAASLTFTTCPTYTVLSDPTINVGIKFTLPASGTAPVAFSEAIGARSQL